VECGCQCTPQAKAACAGKFNDMTCECECPLRLFGEEKIRCESQAGAYWDTQTCQCRGNSIKARGVDLERHIGGCNGGDFREVVPLEAPGLVDVTTWLLLGSSLTMVLLLATTTVHYRRRSRTLKEETLTRPLTVTPDHLLNSEEVLPRLLRENTVVEPHPHLRGQVVVERARCFDNQSLGAGASLASVEATCPSSMAIAQQHSSREIRNGDKHGFSNMYCGASEMFLNPGSGDARGEDSY